MVHHSQHLDTVFGALADPTRRAVLARLRESDASVGELAAPFAMSLPGFMKHLDVLEDAGLIARHKSGRTVSCRLTGAAMKEARDWLDRYEAFWNARLDRLEAFLQRKENEAWRSPPKKRQGSRSDGSSAPRSPPSTPRGRTRSK